MTFRLTCPVCGARDVYEFRYGGPERGPRPEQEGLSSEDHFRWAQFRMTRMEPQDEWWYHASGCGVWFSTRRDPATNREVRPGGGEPGRSSGGRAGSSDGPGRSSDGPAGPSRSPGESGGSERESRRSEGGAGGG